FFQAEDGIRDPLVTGVQTCALPIYMLEPFRRQKKETADAQQEWAAKVMTNRKTYVVSDNCTGRRGRHHANQVELIGMSGGEISRSEERRVGKEWKSR